MEMKKFLAVAAIVVAATASTTHAGMRITEWEYNGSEFIEFTNLSGAPIDMAGWSFDDIDNSPGAVDLSAFMVVAPQQSVILSEVSAADFRTTWGLPASVVVIGGNTNNLGRSDQINLYDAGGDLVDRLDYGDQTFPGTIRTDVNSGNPMSLAAVGANNVSLWQFSSVGDQFGSYSSVAPNPGHLGNPGSFALVPEPTSLLLTVLGAVAAAAVGRRRSC